MSEIIPTQLYVVPTPIGNLEDITLRAIRVLKEADLILAEDTRVTARLLSHLGISKPLQSYHTFNEHQILSNVIKRITGGETIALVSDAGTPAISDPGFLLVRECLKHDIKIECLPGPTAFVPALVKSGIPSDSFVFEGFLPHKKGRQTRLKLLSEESRTMIFYESPMRLVKTLEQFKEYFGAERTVSVSREISKLFEETINGTLEEVLHNVTSRKEIKGEIVIVVSGKE